ncbi:Formiminotransferase N-terminal subdomain-containing protein [Holothuria leucospilota]|uniref:Formiminotransferase N-terminal subdomain-containing protein n=1 Tax=Holothuria leucospilota TaxID=206669 RepID=A0A9Q1H6F1_HOLLE|nr:Formiminotransferase N-terminal subdomain-containing protein [Holothuria leucospilota]
MATRRIAACLLNVSEGRNQLIIEAIASAAALKNENFLNENSSDFSAPSTVLNIFSDFDYNRSVITIAAPISYLSRSVVAASTVALKQIDMRNQEGVHPRLGAVDLIPIHPLCPSVSLEECGDVARDIADQLATEVPGFSCFFFGSAHTEQKSLVERRKEVGWFQGRKESTVDSLRYDVGAKPSKRYGLTGIGASYYVMNCNVSIKTQDLKIGRQIAKAIRGATPGGLPGVQAMAFPHNRNIEVACNVESFGTPTADGSDYQMAEGENPSQQEVKDIEGSRVWHYTSPQTIEKRVREMADKENIELIGTALVGFTPEEAFTLACECLKCGDREIWRTRNTYHM